MDLMTVKLALVVVGVLGLGLWQLYDVNRELKKHDETDTPDQSDATPGADRSGEHRSDHRDE